jgi:hypothetical protein
VILLNYLKDRAMVLKEKYQILMESVKIENTDLINELLIDAGKKADKEFLIYVDYLIENASKSVLDKVKINIVYLLGEIGRANILENKYLGFLIKIYYNSDRWVRDEFIQALGKLVDNHKFSNEIFHILAYALIEDYIPIKVNTLKLLNKMGNLPDFILKNLLKTIDNSNPEVVEYSIQILKKHITNDSSLFDIFNSSGNYKILTKNATRVLLVEYFDSLAKLENFRIRIEKADWHEKHKSLLFKEIDSYQRILISRQ